VDDLLEDLRPSVKYRTAAEVRAIPAGQWERWVRGYDSFSGIEFASSFEVQKTLRTILKATKRRLGVR
jgi:hypothetical protein